MRLSYEQIIGVSCEEFLIAFYLLFILFIVLSFKIGHCGLSLYVN